MLARALVAAWMASAGSVAHADDPTVITPVVVEGSEESRDSLQINRSRSSAEDSTGFVEVIDLGANWRTAQDVTDIIGRSTSLRVRARGGRNHTATLSVRGSSANRVRVLLDGAALGRAADPVVDLSLLPTESIDSIEIFRGFTPVGFAASGAASTLNIKTQTATEPGASFAVSYGSYDTSRVTAQGAARVGGGSLSSLLSWKRTEGNFRYINDNGTINNSADDRVETKRNNEVESVDLSNFWSKPMDSGIEITVRNFFLARDEGLPGQESVQNLNSSVDTQRNILTAGLGDRDGTWTLGASMLFLNRDLRLEETNTDTAPIPTKSGNRTWAFSTTGRWSKLLADTHFLELSGQADHERFSDSYDDDPRSGTTQQRNGVAIAAGDEIEVTPLNLLISLQLRHQRLWNEFEDDPDSTLDDEFSNDELDSTDPRLGLRWSPLSWFDLRANAATTFRAPDFSELFGSDGLSVGNPNLKPEDGKSFDAGFSLRTTTNQFDANLEYTWFENRLDDGIVVVLTSNRVAKALNIDKTRIRGHEISVDVQGPVGLGLSANYVNQDPRSLSISTYNQKLSGVADEEFATRLQWQSGAALTAYQTTYVGAHSTDSENSGRLPIGSRLQHDISLTLGPFRDWVIAFELENLSDTLVPDELGFPVPGRSFFATVSYAWEADQPASPKQ